MARSQSRSGFTLLEVCLAIFIALLIISVAIPSLSGLVKGREAEESFDAFNRLVRQARLLSLEERRPYVLEWTKEAVVVRPDEGENREEIERLDVGKEEDLSLQLTAALRKETQPLWTFWPSGVCEPATVTYQGKGVGWSAVFHPLTAEATVTYE